MSFFLGGHLQSSDFPYPRYPRPLIFQRHPLDTPPYAPPQEPAIAVNYLLLPLRLDIPRHVRVDHLLLQLRPVHCLAGTAAISVCP